MAGLDKEYNGEAWVAEGARVGYLEQEPHLDPSKTVRENVMLGVAKQKAMSPLSGLERPSRLSAGDESEVEVTVAMTNPVFFPAASATRSAFWGADG